MFAIIKSSKDIVQTTLPWLQMTKQSWKQSGRARQTKKKKRNTDENATKLSELMSTSSGRTVYGLYNTEETLTG